MSKKSSKGSKSDATVTSIADRFPKKYDERSRDAEADPVISDKSPPPEIAKSMTIDEARNVITRALKPIQTETFQTSICGEQLIVHAWGPKALKKMLTSQQMTEAQKRKAKENREPKNPKQEFEEARYHWDGKDWFPVNGIKKAMVTAGFALSIPRSLIQRCVFITGVDCRDYVELKCARLVMREDHVEVGPFNKRTADLRYRPEYQNWSADLRIKFRSDLITEEQVLVLLQNAGFSVGIGEWRPERDGQAGTFEIAESAKGKRRAG